MAVSHNLWFESAPMRWAWICVGAVGISFLTTRLADLSRTLAIGSVVLMLLFMVVPIIAVHRAKKHYNAQMVSALQQRTVGEGKAGN
jgi:drug/metabolite transporter (DMT)-like permease